MTAGIARPDEQATPAAVAPVHPLNAGTLLRHAERLHVPGYDRSALTPAVVHLSVGGFSRAHQLVYFDELAESGDTGWGVVGVGLHSPTMRDALAPQDTLYTLVERDAGVERARVVGAMVDYVYAPDDPERVLSVLADPRTRLVTMTITDAAYLVDRRTGEYRPDAEALRDLATPHQPRSVFGHLVEALARRRTAGLPPFTVLSCDNVPANGAVTRAAVVGHAQRVDEVLARWIADTVAFPSSMVDRITPATSPEERAAIAERFGVDDRWPVVTEPFTQWFIEDSFSAGRPPLDGVGVRFVPDVAPYALMKTRLLNAGHSALGHLGVLAGHQRIDQLMADELFRGFIRRLMAEEVGPLLPPPPGIDLDEYQQVLLGRFANPAIADGLDRLCRRSSTKIPGNLLPSLRAARRAGRPSELLTLAVAGWVRYLRGTDLAGRPLQLPDARAAELGALARAGGTDPRPLLAAPGLFGDLADDAGFVAALTEDLEQLDRDGVAATLAAHLTAELAPNVTARLSPTLAGQPTGAVRDHPHTAARPGDRAPALRPRPARPVLTPDRRTQR
ncbi:mannitol dehydrogenase family protein [Modestobacter sp. NPDC049651]|uniref:mannitol dehydrogenase family protein n=1 Tax=unclassified Modestobacter TaxID=2643866 RepID=UPI00340D2604